MPDARRITSRMRRPWDSLDIWFRRRPMDGLRTVEAALARYPLDSIPLLDRPYVTLALIYASAGRPRQARALLTRYEREVNPTFRHIDEPRRQWAWGQVALAEGRYADAVVEFQAYVPTPRHCLACGQAALAQAYDRLGNSDSAIAVYERYVTTPSLFRMFRLGRNRPGQPDLSATTPLSWRRATSGLASSTRNGGIGQRRGTTTRALSSSGRF